MSTLSLSLLLIVVIFIAALVVGKKLIPRLCAICAAVSGTWVLLVVSNIVGYPIDKTVLALLLGESVVGGYYLMQQYAPRSWDLFRLPLLLTMTWLAYGIVTPSSTFAQGGLVVTGTWVAFAALHAWRSNKHLSWWVAQIIACCRNW
jgi:hypothetical protein